MPSTEDASWRATYFLGVALLLPIGTIVLVCYYFTRMNPFDAGANHWAFSVIAISGGLSAVMAALLALFASVTYRARVRFENEYRNLQRYLNEDVAKERTRMVRNLDVFSAAQQVSMAIKQEVNSERILSVVMEQLEHFAKSDSVAVFTIDEAGTPVPRAERRRGHDRFPPALTLESLDCSLVAEAARCSRPQRSLNEATGEFVLAVYFSTPEGLRGVVRICRNVADEQDFNDEMPAFEQAVNQLVRMASLGLKTANMWDRAIKDEKTGLYNANHYADQIRKQVAVARRTGMPLSLIMMDIDKFKHINDTYGHLAGDRVLAQVATILMREARDSDTPFRYGGEELCIICTGSTGEDALQAAERMRQVIACTEFHDDRGRLLPISASFGVAEYDESAMAGDKDLKEACDQALYQGKENGRNVVVLAEGREKFRIMERSGDLSLEVKRRMGLAGDNSPLDGDADPKPLHDAKAASARAQLGESIDALATGLVEIVGTDNERARVVDCVVREAAEFLTRNLSARLGGSAPDTKAADSLQRLHTNASGRLGEAATKPKRRPRKKAEEATPPAVTPAAIETPAPLESAKAKRKRAPRKPKAVVVIPAPLTEQEKLAADSDRLDFLTDEEGDQLAKGKAPSKRLRRLTMPKPAA
ncbi:MAG: diguanylate cyclase [Planctomycetes bacterium]|nr:diguanylate cyclase [Planctomycetota bacterium]